MQVHTDVEQTVYPSLHFSEFGRHHDDVPNAVLVATTVADKSLTP